MKSVENYWLNWFILSREGLLRISYPVFTNNNLINRSEVERLMISTTIDSKLSLQMTLLSDALQHVDRNIVQVSLNSVEYESVICQFNMSSHHHHVQNLSYFTHINNTTHTMEYILSKVLPQACQSRTTGIVIRKCLELLMKRKIKHPTQKSAKVPCPNRMKVMNKLKQIVLVSLLGNYLHVNPATRPVASVRGKIAVLANNTEWILTMLKHSEQVINYCICDYLVYAIEDDPALYRFMSSYMHFEKFKTNTCKYMDEARTYFNLHLQFSHTPLYISTTEIIVLDELKRYHKDLSDIFVNGQSDNLLAKFHRPNPPFAEFLLERKNKYPPNIGLLNDIHMNALKCMVGKTPRKLFFGTMLVLLPSFGINDPDLLNALRLLLRLYEVSSVSVLRLKLFIEGQDHPKPFIPGFIHNFPYLYAILQTGCMLWSEFHRVQTLANLPAHYIVNQINAAQSSLGLEYTQYASPSQFEFVYCDVCDGVYSLLREIHNDHKSNTVVPSLSINSLNVKQPAQSNDTGLNYMRGYQDAIIDYETGDMYCNNTYMSKKIQQADGEIRSCGDRPLQTICILGKVIKCNSVKNPIMLCPQDSCGVPMVWSTDCAYTSRGVCCSDCTKAIEETPLYYDELLTKYNRVINTKPQCAICFNQIDTPKRVYMYPYNIELCRKHHSSRLIRVVDEVVIHKNGLLCADCGINKLCLLHYQEHMLLECERCAQIRKSRNVGVNENRILLCAQHRDNQLVIQEKEKINRIILLSCIHNCIKQISLEKQERISNNRLKVNQQNQRLKNAQHQKQQRRK